MKIAAFDIGGTFVKYGIGDRNNFNLIETFPTNLFDGISSFYEDVFRRIKSAIKDEGINGVSISTAGIVDPVKGIVASGNDNLPGYIGTNWPKMIKDRFNLSCYVENDVNCAALAEYKFRQENVKSLFCITIGTGIGGAYVEEGKVLSGHAGKAGEIGYFPINGKSLENLSSTTALIKKYNADSNKDTVKDGKEFFSLVKKDNELANNILREMSNNLAKAFSSVILLLDPETIIIGGGISEESDLFIPLIEEELKNILPKHIYPEPIISKAFLKNEAGAIGAIENFYRRS